MRVSSVWEGLPSVTSTLSEGIVVLALAAVFIIAAGCIMLPPPPPGDEKTETITAGDRIALPVPDGAGTVPVEEALASRRSVREYAATPLGIADLSQLLWAAQGVTSPSGSRAAPSAGALYPLEIYAACGNVAGLPAGVYHYLPKPHALERVIAGDVREDLYAAALHQPAVLNAPAVIVIAADYNRTTAKYGERGTRYVHMEAGHASENIYLQAYTLGIGTVAIGAFDDSSAVAVLGLPGNQTPLYLMPVGRLRTQGS